MCEVVLVKVIEGLFLNVFFNYILINNSQLKIAKDLMNKDLGKSNLSDPYASLVFNNQPAVVTPVIKYEDTLSCSFVPFFLCFYFQSTFSFFNNNLLK